MPGDKFFMDTNIMVYHAIDQDPRKRDISSQLVNRAIVENCGIISYQVVQECVHVLLKDNKTPLPLTLLETYLRKVLLPLCLAHSTQQLYLSALSVKTRYSFHWYDSLIVAAALETGCKVLYTEDLQDGQVIDGLVIKNPFGLA
ncbi:MAG: PIN domain-containing protein [Methylococcaceae bacterium]|nr:PIN domain-containing protein [Methylococcaceae bacterium]